MQGGRFNGTPFNEGIDRSTGLIYGTSENSTHSLSFVSAVVPKSRFAFAFYRTAKGGRAVWTESHFVAVDNGVYAVELGADKPFPKTLDLSRAWVSVAVTGGKEIVRELFTPDADAQPKALQTPLPPKPSEPSVGAPPTPSKGTYADQAGFAYEAEKASRTFIREMVFPAGCLPSVRVIDDCVRRVTDLRRLHLDDLTAHYPETLRRWRERFVAAGGRLEGLGYDRPFRRLWELYLAYSEAGFRERRIRVVQMSLAKPERPAARAPALATALG